METEFPAESATGDSQPDLQLQGEDDEESDGNTSFLRAARDGNLQEVLEYLKGSTDINTSNPNGLNALHLASKEGHIDIVTELLKRGANVEASTKKGNTALHIASLAGHLNIVKLLVENKAKYDVQAHVGFTPLYMAAQEGHADVVKYLLSNGANQSLSTKDGFTPLAVALQQGHERVVSVLLESDTKGKVKLPALHVTARKDDIKSAALLLQNEQNNVDAQTKSGALVNDTTKSGFTPLHIASHYGNTNVGSLLIQRGADVNFKAKNNITPLHVASRWGKPNMVTLLLDNKAVADEKTRDGLTPLHCAARSGHENVVDLLIERGAPKSAKTKNGLTPLHMAAQGDHVDCARLLLYHRAPVDDVTVDYLTPLHVAAHCGNVKTAKLLLDRKCDPNTRALNGFTPLHIACKKNRIKVVELLLKYGATIEATTESGLTPLHVASFMGHMNIVIYLIQNNANPDFTTVRGETALHLAARANQTDIIRILLRNRASVDARAREQQTPLHIAARLGNVDNVTLLLQHGAAPDAVTKDLYTPLHIAAKEGHEEVASVLLEHGASHSLTTKKGFTPLHIASKYGNIKVARLLLQKDANPDCQGKNGLTPLHVATHYNHVNVALLLLDNKASPHSIAKNGYTPLHIAAKKNQMDIATTLLEFSARPDAESKNGFTPLHLAAQEGHTDMVSLLLEHKADVNAKAHNGLTSLHLAAQEDKVNVAEVLVKYNTEIDPQTKAGYTPLHTACHFGQLNMVRFLLEHNASVSATTKLGYTPLHQAAQQGHVQVINQLLKYKASPNAVTNNGQTALSIAQRLGYISVVDTLQPVTEVVDSLPSTEDKIKLMSPEIMQEHPISDSDDEGDDDFLPSSPLFGKPLTEQHVYLPYIEGNKMQSREDSISLGEKGGSISPLDTSYEKDVSIRPTSTDDARRRITSEIGTSMRYPSYLERGPDYEAEMRYFSGDSLISPRDKSKDSVFGGDYSTLDRLDSTSINSETKLRSMDEHGSEIDYDDDLDDRMKKDYCEAQIMTASYSAYTHATPPDAHLPVTSADKPRVGSYSGSSFSADMYPDNVAIDQVPTYSGRLKWKSFLISFMVDARGGAMRGRRHSGVRIIIPPCRASMPTRVTCRLIKKDKLMHPLPLNEGEALAARIIEMGPVGTKFLGRIVIEIPHFASLRGKEREVKIMRSNNGEKWEEHPIAATDDAVQKALHESMEDLDYEDDLAGKRVTRILTDDFPRYFAVVTKVKEEKQFVGEEGGIISSTVVPQVQAVFPEGALTKRIRVGLQAQPISPDLVSKLLGNRVAVSPIVTVEPRRRKFHKNITLTIPVPKAAQKGMINQYGNEAPTLRVLYSISEGTESAVWDDLTDQTELTFTNDCVSFTTRVSGRFWLMDCQNVSDACRFATELYREAIVVPYMARFVVFAKRTGDEEGKLRMFCMTDDRIDKTLEKQEHFMEVARSRDVEVLEGRPQFVEMAGNLIPITKSGDQLYINFKAFRENRLPCLVKIRDHDQEAAARVAFMKEPKVARGEVPQTPICNLNIALPDMSTSSSMELDGEAALELRKRSSLLREHGIVVEDTVSRAKINLSDVADTLKGDWVILATQLDVSHPEISQINSDYKTVNDQALAMLTLWKEKKGDEATGNELEKALKSINREDVVTKCMYNVETVQDEVEKAAAKVAMDQSGFDTFQEEVGISQETSMRRNMSLDVQFDEQDIQKESESVADESPSSEGPAPQALVEDLANLMAQDESLIAEVSDRRPQATETVKPEKKTEDFLDLIDKLDQYNKYKEEQERYEHGADMDDSIHHDVNEDEIVHSKHDRPKSDEIIAKWEEGQRSAPPPPGQSLSTEEETRTHQTSVDELAARLSATEEAKHEHPGETETYEDVVKSEHVPVESAVSQEQAPSNDFKPDEKLVKPKPAGLEEPDMERIVESLRTDLFIPEKPESQEVKRERSDSSSSSSSSPSEGDFDVQEGSNEELKPSSDVVDAVLVERQLSGERKRKRTDSLSSSSLSEEEERQIIEEADGTTSTGDVKHNVVDEEDGEPDSTDEPRSALRQDIDQHEHKEIHVHFEEKEAKTSSSSDDSRSSSDEEMAKEDGEPIPAESNLDAELPDGKKCGPPTPKIDRVEEFQYVEKPSTETKTEELPVKVYRPASLGHEQIEADLKLLSDDKKDAKLDVEETQPIDDSEIEKQISHAPPPPKEDSSSSSSSSSSSGDEDDDNEKNNEKVDRDDSFREASIERVEQYETVPEKEQTQRGKIEPSATDVPSAPESSESSVDGVDGVPFAETVHRIRRLSSKQQQEGDEDMEEDEFTDEDDQDAEEDSPDWKNEYSNETLSYTDGSLKSGEDNAILDMPNINQQVNVLTAEERNIFSSYENVYEGVPLDPKINRLSLDATDIDIGDRFDTKQTDMHLRSNDRASSYEQVYAQDPTDQSFQSDLAAILEVDKKDDKESSSGSEVAQHDNEASDEDIEVCETGENDVNETDVEEQFSPILVKTITKPSNNLQFETNEQHPSLLITDSPTDSQSPRSFVESPEVDKLSISQTDFTVGISPSAYSENVSLEHDTKKESLYEQDKVNQQSEIQEECLICTYEYNSNVEEFNEQTDDLSPVFPTTLTHEYPDYKSESPDYQNKDICKPALNDLKNRTKSVDEISPEDLEERDFVSELKLFDNQEKIGMQGENETAEMHDESLGSVNEANLHLECLDDSSESSSDTNEVAVLDDATGQYVKMPWEIVYQFKRQLSETYDQSSDKKKSIRPMKSVDMGSFYRRDPTKDCEKDLTFLHEQMKSDVKSNERDLKKEVRFSEEIVDIKCEIDSGFRLESNDLESTSLPEPHEKIDESHEQTVISYIMENRKLLQDDFLHDDQSIQYQDSFTSTRDIETGKPSIIAGENISREKEEASLQSELKFQDNLSGEELFARDDVTTETTLTPTMETDCADTSFGGLVVTESETCVDNFSDARIEQVPLSKQKEIPSLIGKFPMALPTVGKAIADNEIYESSETGGDTTEEKLSPIDETLQDDFPEEIQEEPKPQVAEKHVTFQTNVQHLHSGSSEDLVKTSTSSSEMEPTILAASYDLDSGRVSHVVASFDVSPDTVEKQFVPTPAKAILSSPEDDVFETELNGDDAKMRNLLSVSDKKKTEAQELIETHVSSSSKPLSEESPSLTIPAVEVMFSDLSTNNVKENIDLDHHVSENENIVGASAASLSGSESPFEVMSPSELDGYDQYLEQEIPRTVPTSYSIDSIEEKHVHTSQKDEIEELAISFDTSKDHSLSQITAKSDSSFEHSSPLSSEPSEKGVDSPFETIPTGSLKDNEVTLPDIMEGINDTSSKRVTYKSGLPNGPTEVDYHPDIDWDFPNEGNVDLGGGQSEVQPDIVQSITSATDEEFSMVDSADLRQSFEQVGDDFKINAQQPVNESQTVLTHSIIEELQAESQEHLISSDQTLYGLEMPSEESSMQMISSSQVLRHETETESESINVSAALISQTDEDTSEQSISRSSVSSEVVKLQNEQEAVTTSEETHLETVVDGICHEGKAMDVNVSKISSFHAQDNSIRSFEYDLTDDVEKRLAIHADDFGGEMEILDDEDDKESYDNVLQSESLSFECDQSESKFDLEVDSIDLERPSTPTPVDKNQHFFAENEGTGIETDEVIHTHASEFVESVLNEACARLYTDDIQEETVDKKLDSEDVNEQKDDKVDYYHEQLHSSANEYDKMKASDSSITVENSNLDSSNQTFRTHSVLVKQISEDIPGITLTTHFDKDGSLSDSRENVEHEENDHIVEMNRKDDCEGIDDPYISEIQPSFVFSSECIPEEPEDLDSTDSISKTIYHDVSISSGKVCIPEEEDNVAIEEEVHIKSSTRPLTVLIPQDKTDSSSIIQSKSNEGTETDVQNINIIENSHSKNEYEELERNISTGYNYEYESDDSLDDNYQDVKSTEAQKPEISEPTTSQNNLNQDKLVLESNEALSENEKTVEATLVSESFIETTLQNDVTHDDLGDTSSVESFTTVVPVDQEDDEYIEDDNRLDDFASMTSSCHSDIVVSTVEDDETSNINDMPVIDWSQQDIIEFEKKNRRESEEERKIKELREKQEEELQKRFQELKALKDEKDRPLIDWEEGSESSMDSDRYEFVDKTALSIITENSDEDKFESIDTDDMKSERSEPTSDRPFGSPEDFPPPSPGISKFFNKSGDRDDISITSSLLEFETLEREISASASRGSIENCERDNISVTSSLAEFERLERELQSGSSSSVEKITSGSNSKESDVEGSRASLNDIDRLEHEIERKDSVESMSRRSESSSIASLNEFERLEQEIALADELEAEAQKIVSILESGALMNEEIISKQTSSLMTFQSQISKASTATIQSEETEDLEDSLSEEKTSVKKDIEQAEVDSLDGDMSELTSLTSSVILNKPSVKELDEDSLHDDEESMKISSDSLGEQLGTKSSSDKDKFETDSLLGHEGIMERSADSLEGEKRISTDEKLETDSLSGQDEMQRSSEDVMQTSVDSLESSKSRENLLESSMYSVDSSIFSRSSIETMKSAGSQQSDSSTEIMQVSAESREEKKRREKQWLIDNYHSYRESGHGVEPLIDQEGNVLKSFRIEDNYGYGWDDSDEDEKESITTQKPFSWGPYEEKKKIYTMAELEAMREEKRRSSLLAQKSEIELTQTNTDSTDSIETTQVITKSETTTMSSFESYKSSSTIVETSSSSTSVLKRLGRDDSKAVNPVRIASIDDDDFAEYDVTEHRDLVHGIPEHLAQKSGPIYIDPEMVDSEEDEILEHPLTREQPDGAEGGEIQTTRLNMKKEVHTRTILKDGEEQTFVHEETRIQQDADPPDVLKDSMQQIIDQFMESPVQPDQHKELEHDV